MSWTVKKSDRFDAKKQVYTEIVEIWNKLNIEIHALDRINAPKLTEEKRELEKNADDLRKGFRLFLKWVEGSLLTKEESDALDKIFIFEESVIANQISSLSNFINNSRIDEENPVEEASLERLKEIPSLLIRLRDLVKELDIIHKEDNVAFVDFVGRKKLSEKPKRDTENVDDPSNWIILPEKRHGDYSYPKLLVSKGLSFKGETWNKCQTRLHQENYFMLTIRQFVDFLNLLRSGNVMDRNGNKLSAEEIKSIYDEIVAVKPPYRGEWLDAKFNYLDNKYWKITYHKISSEETLVVWTEPLQTCLMENKLPGINFDYWLENANSQGLPPVNNRAGDLYYVYPIDGTVPGFGTRSVRVGFGCELDPADSDPGRGVRRAKIFRGS